MSAPKDEAKRQQIIELKRQGKSKIQIHRETGYSRCLIRETWIADGGDYERPKPQPEQFTAYEGAPAKPRIRVKAGSQPWRPEAPGDLIRVCVVSDTHDEPGTQQHRFDHIGRWVADLAPDYLVHLGDWSDMTFASRFEGRHTITGREKPPFMDELDSLRSAIERMQTPIAQMTRSPKLLTTLGNHCERAWLFECETPEIEGMLWGPFMDALSDWTVYPYRQYAFIGGVGFTHMPQTIMNKPYGGRSSENSIGNDATYSTVFGHTHRSVYKTVAKNGPNNQITLFNPGAAMDYGYIKPYAMLATTGWSWGVGYLEICDGRIVSHAITGMDVLARRYGQ